MSAVPATQSPLQYLDEALAQLERDGLHRSLRELEGEQLPRARFDGREVINLSSNNYLGLTTHPRLREAGDRGEPLVWADPTAEAAQAIVAIAEALQAAKQTFKPLPVLS